VAFNLFSRIRITASFSSFSVGLSVRNHLKLCLADALARRTKNVAQI
jgi:hypothetical protein